MTIEANVVCGLRLHAAAQPEMRALAVAMWEARKASTPKELKSGEWHLPFVDDADEDHIMRNSFARVKGGGFEYDRNHMVGVATKVSVARCARVSYESFETGKRSTIEEDLRLYDRLTAGLSDPNEPLHASPMEHQATPIGPGAGSHDSGQQGNFVGWRQYRKMLPNEAVAPLPEEYR